MFKKILSLVLILGLITSHAFAVDKWLEGTGAQAVAGADSPADLDDLIQDYITNPLDRIADAYRSDAVCLYASAATITVSIGCVATDSATGVHRMRENTSAVTVTWTNIETGGSEAASTYYYVYAVADADATTFTITISTSSTAPTGVTYYKKIGWFYNDASSNIIEVGNVKTAGSPNKVSVAGTSDISTSSSSYVDMTDMVVYFVSHGRPVEITFNATLYNTVSSQAYFVIDVDGTDKKTFAINPNQRTLTETGVYLENLSAGTHTVKVQWKETGGGTIYQRGSTDGARTLIVEEN